MLAAILLTFLSVFPRSYADELTETAGDVRDARTSSLSDIRRFLSQGALNKGPGADSGNEGPAIELLLDKLRMRSSELQVQVDRLTALRADYPKLADLGAIDGKRAELRRALEAGDRHFTEQLVHLELLQKMLIATELQKASTAKGRGSGLQYIGGAVRIGRSGKDVRDFKPKLRETLQADEDAYTQRTKALEEQRARERAIRIAAMAGAGAFLGLGGLTLWVFRRGRRGAGPAGPGSVIGRAYRLDRELGRGGMGLVFEATDIGLRRKVAIKQLRAELKENPKDLERFLAEARLVAALKHPHIVEIYAIVNEGSDVHLVFELVAGQPLHIALQEVERMTLDTACSLMKQVGSALDFAHARNIIHRDLKPGNIMLSPQGTAKVMDFGLAHQASMTVAKLTKAESWGTPPYMAPEQELGEISRESDLYAMGVMLYELVTGKLPFPGPNYLAQKRELHWTLPSQAVPGLPKSLDGLLLRALQPDPKLRFHSAAELVQALERVA